MKKTPAVTKEEFELAVTLWAPKLAAFLNIKR